MPESDEHPPPGPSASAEQPDEQAGGAQTGRNPGAGCLIIVIALLSLGFLVSFGIWNLFKQDRELSKFTEPDARKAPLLDLEKNAAEVNVLNSKIETFTTDQGNKRPAALSLTPREINLAIAAFDEFEELRQTFSVREIKDGQLFIDISFPLRGSPLKADGRRFLNGTMVATPTLAGSEIILEVDRIEVPDKTVPDGFVGQLSPYRPTKRYLQDETLGPWMKRLTKLAVEGGTLSLVIDPAENPPESGPPPPSTGQFIRAAVVFGIVLLGVVGLMIFAASRGKRGPETEQ